jgi:hypothetical protein
LRRRRAKIAATPAPNISIIGGSGTWVPDVVLVHLWQPLVEPLVLLEPEVLVELDVELELLDDVDELLELLDDVDVLEVMLPEVEVLVETLPEDDDVVVLVMPPVLVVVVLVMPPVLVDVELPPDEVEVDDPPVEVEVELPLTITVTPPLLLELPDEEPLVVVVELISTWPPPLDPPKKPPKKPPPKPPKPLEPPITTGVLPPPPLTIGAWGGRGKGTGTIAICCSSTQTCLPSWSTRRLGASHSSVTMRRVSLTLRGIVRLAVLTYLTGLVVFTSFTERVENSFAGASATCTAPPTARAPPAATADSFARAIRTDMVSLSTATGFA